MGFDRGMKIFTPRIPFFSALMLFTLCVSPNRAAQQIDLRGMGFVTGIVAHPADSTLVYARTDVGGLFRWDSGNGEWIPLMDLFTEASEQDRYSIESVALDPNNPDRVYVATGLGIHDTGARYEILRSEDRGATWTPLGLPGDVEIGGNNHWRWAGERLAVDPHNPDILYFGSRQDGLQFSRDGGSGWSRQGNVPTGDHGGKLTSGKKDNGGVTFVAIDGRENVWNPKRARTVYAGVMGEGVWRSIDGGTTFSKLTGGPGDRLNPIQGRVAADGTLYVTFSPDEGDQTGGAVYAYNGGWRHITPGTALTFGNRRWVGVGVDPNNSARIVVTTDGNTPRDFFLSENGGVNWISIGADAAYNRQSTFSVPDWYSETEHLWSRAGGGMFDSADSNRLWISTGYGVYRTDDVGANPVRFKMKEIMKGLEEIVGTQVFAYPEGAGAAFAATVMDKVGFVFKGPATLPDKKMGLGQYSIANGTGYAFSWQNPDYQVIVGGTHNYAGTVAARSTDGGVSWTQMAMPTGTASAYGSTFAGNVAVSSTDPNRILWVPLNVSWYDSEMKHVPVYSTDGGARWSAITGLPRNANPVSQIWFRSCILVADTVDGDVFYFYEEAYPSAKIHRSSDGGRTFSVVNNSEVPGSYIVKMQAAPDVEGELWVGVDGKGVYYTRDGGVQFQAAGQWEDFFSFSVGPRSGQAGAPMLYVHGKRDGTEAVYRSNDWGETWALLPVEVPLVKINDLAASLQEPGDLVFATAGRGLFYYTDPDNGPSNGTGGEPEAGANILTNPGFDPDIAGWSLWSQGGHAPGLGVNGGAGRAGEEGVAGWGAVVQTVALEPDTDYVFGGTGKSTRGDRVELIVKVHDGSSETVHAVDFTESGSYETKDLRFTTPVSVSWAQLYFIHHGGTGSFLMDDLFLQTAGSTAAPTESGAGTEEPEPDPVDASAADTLPGTLSVGLSNVVAGDMLVEGEDFIIDIGASADIVKVFMWYADGGSDWNWIDQDTTDPFSLTFEVPAGLKNLRVRGFNAGGSATSDVVVEVTSGSGSEPGGSPGTPDTAEPPVAENVLNNSTFDAGIDGWSVWNQAGSHAPGAGVSGGAGRAGNEGDTRWGAVVQNLVLEADTSYTFGGTGRTTAGDTGKLVVKVNDGSASTTHEIDFTDADTYQTKEMTFTTPSSVSWVQVYFIHSGGSGSLLMDDVFVR
jgi:hypothetical protein